MCKIKLLSMHIKRRLCVVEKTEENKRGIRGFISQLIRGLMGCNSHCACLTDSTLNALKGLLGNKGFYKQTN